VKTQFGFRWINCELAEKEIPAASLQPTYASSLYIQQHCKRNIETNTNRYQIYIKQTSTSKNKNTKIHSNQRFYFHF
jgi:hypothetical protein